MRLSHTRSAQQGLSLIVTLIMLVVIGLTAAAAMRNATSSERAINNLRMQNLAQQYAEAGLRYCEGEVSRTTPLTTVTALLKANLGVYSTPGWSVTSTWVSGGSRTVVPSSYIASTDSSSTPTRLPQCFAEKLTLPDSNPAIMITSRGFSPDFDWDSDTSTKTVRGSVVWLQSIVGY